MTRQTGTKRTSEKEKRKRLKSKKVTPESYPELKRKSMKDFVDIDLLSEEEEEISRNDTMQKEQEMEQEAQKKENPENLLLKFDSLVSP